MKKLAEMVNQKLEEGKLLTVGIQSHGVSFVDSVVPESLIDDDECLYVEGDNLILNISKEEVSDVMFDELEEEYVVKCGDLVYLLS